MRLNNLKKVYMNGKIPKIDIKLILNPKQGKLFNFKEVIKD
jgi:hypothetical protein